MGENYSKHKRMEIRRRIGNRVPPRPSIVERMALCLVAHACFSCRVSFKVAPRDRPAICPNCAGVLAEMGRSFKAPRKSDRAQWRKVEKLWLAGYRFPTGWGRANYPEKLGEVDAFIEANPAHSYRLRAFVPIRFRRF